ncbi:MAG TPA: hypothetical protein VD913_05225 [bacterium]|nr:hypothetical protein [bacterium]
MISNPQKQSPFKDTFFILPLLIISAAGILIFNWATSLWGLGGGSDTANYIGGARNIMAGHGYRSYGSMNPITQWPPLFSFSLAVIGLTGIDPLDGARLLHTLLFGINIFIVGFILKKMTQSTAIALLGGWMMLTSTAMIHTHGMAMSEPWFIFLGFTGFFFLIRYLEEGPKKFFFYGVFFTGIACIDRYAGIALIAAGTLLILFFIPRSFLNRLKIGTAFAALSSVPLGFWLLRNQLLAQNLVSRAYHFSWPSKKYGLEVLNTFSSWILPIQVPPEIRYPAFIFAATLGMVVVISVALKEIRSDHAQGFILPASLRFAILMMLFIACNLGLELALRMFVDPHAHANDRHFSAIFVAGLMGFLVLTDQLLKLYPGRRWLKGGVILLFSLLAGSYLFGAAQKYKLLYQEGGGRHTARIWKISPTLAKVKTLPPDALIYTNEPAILYLNANRTALSLPKKYDKRYTPDNQPPKPNEKYPEKIEKIREKLLKKDGYVVFFDKRARWYTNTKKDIQQDLSLIPVYQLRDGTLYKVNESAGLQ